MKPSATRYLLSVLVITIICTILQLIWNQLAPENMRLNDGFILLGFFALVVTAVHFTLLYISQNAPKAFVRTFIASTAVKLILYMAAFAGFLLYSKDDRKVLVLHFLFYYAVFTVLEVSMLYRELKSSRQ